MAQLSRRRFVAQSAVALSAVAAGALSTGVAVASPAAGTRRTVDPRLSGPVDRAYAYLDVVQDAYFTDATPRLLQSYNNESGLLTTGFVYDNALALIAYLSRPTAAHLRRARTIGDAFLWIQANDERFADGRVRQAYAVGPMLFYGGSPEFTGLVRSDGKAAFLWPFGFSGTSVGDAAWVGLALARLYAVTCERRYLDGAVAIGQWIEAFNASPFHFGGYLGGVQADGVTPQPWCSTEHNIDTYALFRMLAHLTRDTGWLAKAQVALGFVRAMWNPDAGNFWTGTQAQAPDEINTSILPEDVNTWGYLALGGRTYSRAVDWVAGNLSRTDGAISGVTFSDKSNAGAVWLEGNGHLASALLARGGPHDRGGAVDLLLETVAAQDTLGSGQTVGRTSDPNGGRLFDPGEGGTWTGSPLPSRAGIVSATSTLDTGFGFSYFPNQHVGATAWFVMAALGVNRSACDISSAAGPALGPAALTQVRL
jgi:hypothetical protein